MSANDAGLVGRTIWVLRAVAAHPNGVGLSDVARESGIPKATCYRVLTVLQREGLLTLDADTRRYRVSLGLLSIVGGFLDRGEAYRHMQDCLTELAETVEETCGFDVLRPPEVMVVAQVVGSRLIGQVAKPVPRTQPVWATSSGKVLLAGLDREHLIAEYGEVIEPNVVDQYGSMDGFLRELDEVAHRGYAYTVDDLEVGAASMAAPVRVDESVPYAIWIGGPAFRLTPAWMEEQVKPLLDCAQRLSGLLGITDFRALGA